MKEETRTVAVRLPLPVYNTLADAYEASDHKRMSDLLRAILHDWAQGWVVYDDNLVDSLQKCAASNDDVYMSKETLTELATHIASLRAVVKALRRG